MVREGKGHNVVGYVLAAGPPNQPDPPLPEFDFLSQDILDAYQGAIKRFATHEGLCRGNEGDGVSGEERAQWWVD
ncbi:hypothetical protein PG994_008608 [Apiospora phragmitis]|uniref:Uncharacterized protein n=1 Tax=Apiospora phragmitis TaxID=2905665 RepID=A0ABR1UJE4_9PEZI